MTQPTGSTRAAESRGQLCVLASLRFTVAAVIWGGLLFWASGTFLWPRGWIHLAVWAATTLVNFAVLLRMNPAVLVARIKSRRFSDQWSDNIVLMLFVLVMLAIPVVGGFDAVRYQWSPVPFWGVYVGITLHVPGNALSLWTMAVNPYLEKAVRIQHERDHRVITTGPYAIVRHPMYVGVILMMTGIPFVLGSVWTFVPVGATVLLLIVRTAMEDKMLRKNLSGYKQYTQQTRYRLCPGIW